mgnify:CR=1 FL=1
MAASSPSRLYLIPIALLILGVLNALFAYSRYEQSADQQLSDQFRSDANTRILVGDAILKRYQTKTRSALATLESNMLLVGGDSSGSERLISLALSAADLMSADTPFATTVLRYNRESGVVQPLVLPPRFSALTGVDLSSDPALSTIDWSNTSKEIITSVAELAGEIGKPRWDWQPEAKDESLFAQVEGVVKSDLGDAYRISDIFSGYI